MATTPKMPPRAARTTQDRAPAEADTVAAPEPESAAQADPRMQPFLGAARSHLDRPANPKPTWPSVPYGTGATLALARLDEAMGARSRKQAEDVDTMRLPIEVGQYKQAVLEWMDREGL